MTTSVQPPTGGQASQDQLFTSSPEASPANRSARRASAWRRMTTDGSGQLWSRSSPRSDPGGCSGRTCPVCSPEDSTSSTPTLCDLDTGTEWGGPPLVQWVPHTHDADCSVWPTPLAKDATRGGLSPHSATYRDRRGCGLSLPESIGGPSNPDWVEWLMGYPVGWTA
jgi:hypothetical protein